MDEESPQFQQKTIEFLKVLDDETREEGAIKFGYDLIQLGSHFGFTDQQTINLIGIFLGKGYIRYTSSNHFVVTQLGRQIIKTELPQQGQFLENDTEKKYSIFISHIHENEAVAKKLKEFLTSIFSDEISVFISGDPENIAPGQDWFASIIDGIRQCDCMIILCSPDSVERKWIHFEAGAATILDRKIIPICFAGLNPGALPSPLNFIRRQAIDSDDAEKLKQHFEILVREIGEHTKGNGPLFDVLRSDFYQELQFSHPRNRMPPSVLPRTF
jgi:hypothetical protein